MENLETLIAAYLKNCETIKKLDRKTLKAYRIDLTQFHTFMQMYPDFINKSYLSENSSFCSVEYTSTK